MSEVIMHIAQPLIDDHCKTPEDMQRMLGLVIAAWNLTLVPEEDRDKWRDDLLRKVFGRKLFGVIPLGVPRVARHMFQWIYECVAQRKEELYPHLDNYITGFETANTQRGIQLSVAYGLEAPQAKRLRH
jgi:hypothetical protein